MQLMAPSSRYELHCFVVSTASPIFNCVCTKQWVLYHVGHCKELATGKVFAQMHIVSKIRRLSDNQISKRFWYAGESFAFFSQLCSYRMVTLLKKNNNKKIKCKKNIYIF